MQTVQYISIFILTLTLLLGIIVLAHGPKKRVNQVFTLLAFAFASWIFTNLMIDILMTKKAIFLWGRLAIIGPFFIPVLLTYFFSLFPKQNNNTRKQELLMIAILAIIAIIGMAFIPTKFNIENVDINKNIPEFRIGTLYIVLFFTLIISAAFSIYIAFKKFKLLNRKEKIQILLIIAGIILAIVSGTLTHIILVIIFDFQKLTNIGSSISALFIVAFTAFAIVKYSSFNINLIFAEIFILIILILLSFETMLSRNIAELIIRLIIFVSALLISYFLIRSIILETERKKEIQNLANQLENANKELKKLDQLKDDFLHIAVHEINTPIASILGYLSLILDEKIAKVDQKAENYLQRIYTSSKRLANVVTDFLNVVRIEGGRIKLNLVFTNLELLIKEVVEECENKAKEKNNKIIFKNLTGEQPKIEIDRDKIKEVLINLIDNAVKFTEEGVIEIELNKTENNIIISVKDNGKGIPSDKIKHIFDKFYQVETPYTRENRGTGLGLYIAKSIIELHDGEIQIESELGRGTKFVIFLPTKK